MFARPNRRGRLPARDHHVTASDPDIVLEVAARGGALMLANGAPSAETASAMVTMARSQGLDDVRPRVSYDEVTLAHITPDNAARQRIVGIQGRDVNLGQYTDAAILIDDVTTGRLPLAEARTKVVGIRRHPGPYPRWFTRLAAGVAGASAAFVFGGNWLVMVFAFVANVIIDELFRQLIPRGWPVFFLQVATGLIGVAAAAAARLVDRSVDPSRVVVSVIIVMLAGMTSTGAVQDAITGWYMSAVGRAFDAAVKTAGLVVGVQIGLHALRRAGHPLELGSDVAITSMGVVAAALAAGVIAVGFLVAVQAPPRALLPGAALTAVSFALLQILRGHGVTLVWASGLAAVVVGVIATGLAQWLRAPVAVFALCAVIPLLPGLVLYQALTLGATDPMVAWQRGGLGLAIALAIAASLVFGEYLAVLLAHPLRIVENRVFTPLFAGPAALRRLGRRSGAAGQTVDEDTDWQDAD